MARTIKKHDISWCHSGWSNIVVVSFVIYIKIWLQNRDILGIRCCSLWRSIFYLDFLVLWLPRIKGFMNALSYYLHIFNALSSILLMFSLAWSMVVSVLPSGLGNWDFKNFMVSIWHC